MALCRYPPIFRTSNPRAGDRFHDMAVAHNFRFIAGLKRFPTWLTDEFLDLPLSSSAPRKKKQIPSQSNWTIKNTKQ